MIARLCNWLFSRRVIVSEDYMIRWHLIPQNRWCNVMLHRFNGADPGRDLHDHPWDFVTIMLRGHYWESVPAAHYNDVLLPFSIRYRKAEYTHAVTTVYRPTWTLVMTGRYRRQWGFHTEAGWVPHHRYQSQQEETP